MKIRKWLGYGAFYLSLLLFLLLLVFSWVVLPTIFEPTQQEIREKFSDCMYQPDTQSQVVNGQKLFFIETGKDTLPLLLLVHGSPGNWSNLLYQISDSALNRRFHIIAVNRPGYASWDYGKTDPALGAQAQKLLGLLNRNKSRFKPILAGHSLGGPIICKMAMENPEAIGGLIILAGSIDPKLEPNEFFRVLYALWPVSLMINPDLQASNEELMRAESELEAMLPDWNKIKCPVTVVQGDADVLVPKGNADFAKKKMPQADIRIIPGGNHFFPWEHPEWANDAILDMYKKLYPEK